MRTKSLPFPGFAHMALALATMSSAVQYGDPPPPLGTPLRFKFTSVQGKPIDTDSLKGKVILIDFWATWCHPCVDEMPNVLAAYQKLHKKGFEIIGITLDSDKNVLTQFLKDHHLPWPQYFDKRGGANPMTARFGINSVPTMWLLDKEGKLANTNARGNLEAEVEKLLGP